MCRIKNIALFIVVLISCIGRGQAQEETSPVKFQVKAPQQIVIGESFTINVQFKLQPDWYIYAPDGSNAAQGKIEAKVVFNPAHGIIKEGRIKLPEASFKDGHSVFQGDNILMSQAFNTASANQGHYIIKCKIIYQTCNSNICLPPITELVNINIELVQ